MSEPKVHLQVKGTPLIKFQSADRIESLQKGHLYAKTLGYYRELEKNTGDMEIGDEYEAMIHVNEGTIHFPDTGETIQLDDTLIETTHSNDFVFCMFGIYPQLDSFAFSDKQKEKMLSFGDTALIITDSDEFKKRVIEAAKAKGYQVHFDAVKYYDTSIDSGNMIIDLMKGMWNVAFWKREAYRYQQEGRFIFISDADDEDHIDLDIGDISDISVVLPSKQVLSAMVKKEK